MTTRIYTHDIFLQHVTPPGHPERAERLRAIAKVLEGDEFAALDRQIAPRGKDDAVLLAHPRSYRDHVQAMIPQTGLARVDNDTVASPMSYEAALHGVGAAVAAVDDVFASAVDNVFVCARPPGHHAEKTRAMGFCLFNNAAIAAMHARAKHGAERVAVIDFDVHHGNGTQDIFWDQKDLFYGSTHQMPLFPGTGATDETGVGNIFNAPLHPGDDGVAFRDAMDVRILPALEKHRPDLIIISAGFDAHERDPLANINLTEDDFAWVTRRLMDIADKQCDGRVVSVLEGGYDLMGLSLGVAAHVRALMGS